MELVIFGAIALVITVVWLVFVGTLMWKFFKKFLDDF